jgi:hypothetical protein
LHLDKYTASEEKLDYFNIYDQKRKRDFTERELSSVDESREELRTKRGKDDLRDGTKRRRDTGG